MSIKVTQTGKGISSLIKEIDRIKKFFPFLKEIGQNLESSTKLRFNNGVDPEGEKWEPSKRIIEQGKGRTLVLTGRLQKSISYSNDEKRVNIGTDIEYAKPHQEGLGRLPERSFLGISSQDEYKIEKIIEKHIEG